MDTPSRFFNDCLDFDDGGDGTVGTSQDRILQPTSNLQQMSSKHINAFVTMPMDAQGYLPLPIIWNPQGPPTTAFSSNIYYEDPLQPKVEDDEDSVPPLRTNTVTATPGSKGSSRTTSTVSTRQRLSSKSTDAPLEAQEDEVTEQKRPKKGKKAAVAPEEVKRDKFLERNRVAASKCRQKKKEWVSDLQGTKFDLESQNTQLQIEYNHLVGEVSRMKNELMVHAGCNDRNIDQWLENEARRFVQKSSEGYTRRHSAPRIDEPQYGTSSTGYRHSFDGGQISEMIPTPTVAVFAQMASPHSASSADVNFDHMPDNIFDTSPHLMRNG